MQGDVQVAIYCHFLSLCRVAGEQIAPPKLRLLASMSMFGFGLLVGPSLFYLRQDESLNISFKNSLEQRAEPK